MKKLIMILALVATSAFAEPSFNQVQDLIGRQQYSAAEAGLVEIIKNHPNSAKAYYSMAQAQAGLGNLDKARYALDKATGLDPTLGFATESQVQSLRSAITPQVAKIEQVEEGHFWRNFAYFVMFALFGWACYFMWCTYNRKRDEDEGTYSFNPVTPVSPTPSPKKEEPVVKATKAEVYRPKTETPKETVRATPAYTAPAPVYSAPAPQPVAHTTVVNNSSNDGLLTGMILGNMMSHHHDHDRVIEREVVREVPVRSSESSSSRSSTWDSDDSSSSWSSSSSSSSRSSSWDSDSSSSSSSWSSSSDSSSSWDSGSSSSSWD